MFLGMFMLGLVFGYFAGFLVTVMMVHEQDMQDVYKKGSGP